MINTHKHEFNTDSGTDSKDLKKLQSKLVAHSITEDGKHVTLRKMSVKNMETLLKFSDEMGFERSQLLSPLFIDFSANELVERYENALFKEETIIKIFLALNRKFRQYISPYVKHREAFKNGTLKF